MNDSKEVTWFKKKKKATWAWAPLLELPAQLKGTFLSIERLCCLYNFGDAEACGSWIFRSVTSLVSFLCFLGLVCFPSFLGWMSLLPLSRRGYLNWRQLQCLISKMKLHCRSESFLSVNHCTGLWKVLRDNLCTNIKVNFLFWRLPWLLRFPFCILLMLHTDFCLSEVPLSFLITHLSGFKCYPASPFRFHSHLGHVKITCFYFKSISSTP